MIILRCTLPPHHAGIMYTTHADESFLSLAHLSLSLPLSLSLSPLFSLSLSVSVCLSFCLPSLYLSLPLSLPPSLLLSLSLSLCICLSLPPSLSLLFLCLFACNISVSSFVALKNAFCRRPVLCFIRSYQNAFIYNPLCAYISLVSYCYPKLTSLFLISPFVSLPCLTSPLFSLTVITLFLSCLSRFT